MLRNHLKSAIRRKGHNLLSPGVHLQRDNGRRHTDSHDVKQFHDLKLKVLPHPPYSPVLTLCDFYLFWSLKDALHGRQFRSDEEVKEAMRDSLTQEPKYLFCREIYALVECLRRCVERWGGGGLS
jgi:hypothetical protein